MPMNTLLLVLMLALFVTVLGGRAISSVQSAVTRGPAGVLHEWNRLRAEADALAAVLTEFRL
jgi:hypothetical protein